MPIDPKIKRILNERLATGEIGKDEYLELLAAMKNDEEGTGGRSENKSPKAVAKNQWHYSEEGAQYGPRSFWLMVATVCVFGFLCKQVFVIAKLLASNEILWPLVIYRAFAIIFSSALLFYWLNILRGLKTKKANDKIVSEEILNWKVAENNGKDK